MDQKIYLLLPSELLELAHSKNIVNRGRGAYMFARIDYHCHYLHSAIVSAIGYHTGGLVSALKTQLALCASLIST